ncbi:kinesin motor domain-containing protein [Delphinella strobiligena]|nr:kinesin motor domain-containing protein [Delphinella strobiligena]
MAQYGENTAPRPSGLKPPSRIPASTGLLEMTSSDNNARAMMPPPPPQSLKHKGSALPEPAPKRKSLAERAADPIRSNGVPRPVNGLARAGASAATRHSSRTMPSSSRQPSFASRPTSVASSYRPASALAQSRSRSALPSMRPPPVTRDYDDGDDESAGEQSAMASKRKAWDTKGRLEDMEILYSQLKSQLDSASKENHGMEDSIDIYKTRISELEAIRVQLAAQNQTLSTDMHDIKLKLSTANSKLDDSIRSHNIEIDDMRRKYRNEMEDAKDDHRKELERLQRESRDEIEKLRRDAQDEAERLQRSRKEELAERERDLKAELEDERSRRLREIQELTTQFALQRQNTDMDVSNKECELQALRNELSETKAKLDGSNALVNSLNEKLAEASANTMTLDISMRAMKAKIDFLESDNQAQSQAFAEIHQQMQDAVDKAAEAQEKLRQEETLRRKLHNQVQELKGNIRVFCRVRPAFGDEETQRADIAFPDSGTDSKEVAIQGPEVKSAMGTVTKPVSGFSFDRVFGPSSQNAEIFDEISQLVQSALDGYNVCIFCYGQTGSGKTHTMSSLDGMIPRAVNQIYETAKGLEDKGWKYRMEGSFVEVYNETLNDLLGKAEEWEKKKHEIRQDPVKLKTTVTDATIVDLDSPNRVNEILEQASRNRKVSATAANSRSSRSHSVFILKLTGENSITGERSEGTLNLVDLAGSERLGHSQATGDRLKETQNINKSLSCLGDVIGALGQGKDAKHIPYRNSKLTYLLQYSLGGNSKTLMFVMISPLQAHLSETLTSLKFATKVHNTHIGTAKQQTKVKN